MKKPNCQDNTCGHIKKMYEANPNMELVKPRESPIIPVDPDVLPLVDVKFSIVGKCLVMWAPDVTYKIGDKYDLMRLRDICDAAINKISELK